METDKIRNHDRRTGIVLDAFILTCLALTVCLFAIATTPPATADTETVAVSYTPSYNTQYSLSVPTGLTLHSDGSATTLTISVASWSDFPTNKSLYCDLSGSNTLTLSNGSDTVGMVVQNGATTIAPGDRIDTFTPSTVESTTSADFIVLTVEPDGKPGTAGVYSGNLAFDCGLVE